MKGASWEGEGRGGGKNIPEVLSIIVIVIIITYSPCTAYFC